MLVFKSNQDVIALMNNIKLKYHQRLEQANICIAFSDAKPFIKNRFNFGKTSRFSKLSKLWQGEQYDFCFTIPTDIWHSVLDNQKREALLDLHLTRCSAQYEPEVEVVNNKKIVLKDENGFVKFTNVMKVEDDGSPKWIVLPLDLSVFSSNIKRFGTWTDSITEIKVALEQHGEVND